MTAAPTYTWKFVCDLFGDRVPKVTALKLTAASLLKKGTMVSMVSGSVIASTDGTSQYFIGLAAEDISTSPTGGDPVKVEIIAPGMVICGSAVDTAAAVVGFNGKTIDIDVDGRLDPDDSTGGAFSVWKAEDSGLTVYVTPTTGALI